MTLRTTEQAREWLRREGISAADWARANGFPVWMVQEILRGRMKGERGQGHHVAVALGLKEGAARDAAS